MPPQRIPLGSIDRNRLANHELSPYQRGIAIGMIRMGAKYTECAKDLKCSTGAIKYFSLLILIHATMESRKHVADVPKLYIEADERNLIRHIRLNPKDIYIEARIAISFPCKTSYIKKILKRHGITNWKARRRPILTEAHAAKRLA
jgi:hypothetical protein